MKWTKTYNVALFWLRQIAWLPAFCHAALAYIFFALVVLHQRAAFSPPKLLKHFPWTGACVLVREPHNLVHENPCPPVDRRDVPARFLAGDPEEKTDPSRTPFRHFAYRSLSFSPRVPRPTSTTE